MLVSTDRGAKERAGEMQERYTFLASLYEVMEGNGVVIGDDTRTAANVIVKVQYQPPSDVLFYIVPSAYKDTRTPLFDYEIISLNRGYRKCNESDG